MTKNENLKKIQKYSDLYKKNLINFEEYSRIVNNSLLELKESNKHIKKLNNGN
jgi:hypothetical protein